MGLPTCACPSTPGWHPAGRRASRRSWQPACCPRWLPWRWHVHRRRRRRRRWLGANPVRPTYSRCPLLGETSRCVASALGSKAGLKAGCNRLHGPAAVVTGVCRGARSAGGGSWRSDHTNPAAVARHRQRAPGSCRNAFACICTPAQPVSWPSIALEKRVKIHVDKNTSDCSTHGGRETTSVSTQLPRRKLAASATMNRTCW